MVTFREGKSLHDRMHCLNVWWAEGSNWVSVSHSYFQSIFPSAQPPVCFLSPGSEACNMVSNGPWCPSFLRAISDLSSLGTHAVLLALIELIFQAAVYCSSRISQWQTPRFISFSFLSPKRPFYKDLVWRILLPFMCLLKKCIRSEIWQSPQYDVKSEHRFNEQMWPRLSSKHLYFL